MTTPVRPPTFGRLLLLLIPLAIGGVALAQADLSVGTSRPPNDPPKPYVHAPGPRSDPPITGTPFNFSGVSGPGQPVDGTGFGGYRSGNNGLMYRGPDPKEGWLDYGARSKGTASATGVIPLLKPIWDLHLRDTQICLDKDGGFLMTGTSGDNSWDLVDGVELWHSNDLESWDYLGLVWSIDRDGTWEKQFRRLWTPEIHLINKNYYILYSMFGGGTGLLKSVSGEPRGPYQNAVANGQPLSPQTNATLFEDDDGSVYFTASSGGVISLMKPDMSGFAETREIRVLGRPNYLDGRTRVGHEGVTLFKANGKYYLGGADMFRGHYSSMCAIANTIWGPYSQVHEAVPCAGGCNYFKDPQGDWWCTYIGNDDQSPWREKPGLLRIEFDRDNTIYIADQQPPFVLQDGANTRWRKGPRINPALVPGVSAQP